MRIGTMLFILLVMFTIEPRILGQKAAQFYLSFNNYILENNNEKTNSNNSCVNAIRLWLF